MFKPICKNRYYCVAYAGACGWEIYKNMLQEILINIKFITKVFLSQFY